MIRRHSSNPRYAEQMISDDEEYAVVDNVQKHVAIVTEGRKKILISLIGVEYEITPPKTIVGLRMAIRAKAAADDPALMMEALDDWIVRAFGKVVAKTIQKRLESEDDDLDFQHITELMQAVVEQVTGNPTSSS